MEHIKKKISLFKALAVTLLENNVKNDFKSYNEPIQV